MNCNWMFFAKKKCAERFIFSVGMKSAFFETSKVCKAAAQIRKDTRVLLLTVKFDYFNYPF